MPLYACWFLWWGDCIEDFEWRLQFQFGVEFLEGLFWERYILKDQIASEGHWRLQSWTLSLCLILQKPKRPSYIHREIGIWITYKLLRFGWHCQFGVNVSIFGWNFVVSFICDVIVTPMIVAILIFLEIWKFRRRWHNIIELCVVIMWVMRM